MMKCMGAGCVVLGPQKQLVNAMQYIENEKIEVLRARAELYRRLANDLLDERTSEEAATLAQELDAEIARLETEPKPARAELDALITSPSH